MRIIILLLITIFGASTGSFFSLIIYRIPRRISIIKLGFFCAECHKPLKFYHKVPIISYSLLKGKCPYCSYKFPFYHILLELLTPLLFLILYFKYSLDIEFLKYLVLTSALIIIFFLDWENRIIPDLITLPLIVIGLLFSSCSNVNIIQSLYGILSGGILIILGLVYKCIIPTKLGEGIGGGDIKLAFAIGAFLGWQLTLLTLFLGSILGLIYYAFFYKKSDDTIPYGTFLSLSGYIMTLYGKEMIDFYLRHI